MRKSKVVFLIFFFLISSLNLYAQSLSTFADSIRITYHIPELGYAVVSSDSIYEIQLSGVRKAGSLLEATPNDRFRIGSNTKAVTAFIAARLVRSSVIKWDTKFFDLYPQLKRQSNKAYYNVTLLDLLSFRVPLISYTYTDIHPTFKEVNKRNTGDENKERYNFIAWFLHRKPNPAQKETYHSNISYVVAGLMLEKASGKIYQELVQSLGKELGINFEFGTPNAKDSLQTWGHTNDNTPEAPAENYKLNWLLPAGNINVTLKDYTKFIQLQLKGLNGQSDMLPAKDFYYLHYGLPEFALGWFWETSAKGHNISHNLGNPGSFTSTVYVIKDINRAYIVFANAQNEDTYNGIAVMVAEMKKRYGD